jgi:hypothetical protein
VTTGWQPPTHLSGSLDGPYADVPEHLEGPLLRWVEGVLHGAGVVDWLALRRRVALPDGGTREERVGYLTYWTAEHPTLLLDYAHDLLAGERCHPERVNDLRTMLTDAGSAYCVSADGRRLETRVAPEVRSIVENVIESADPAGSVREHLTAAWNAAYSRSPAPDHSYSQSVKAVECAAKPLLQPNHARATLGTLIGQLAATIDKWQMVIPDKGSPSITAVLALMRVLWDGQLSRHGDVAATQMESPESAQAAVLLAAVVCGWFGSGAIRRM